MFYFSDYNEEFYQEISPRICIDVIAFANCEGGTVYLGIRKDKEIIGLENSDMAITTLKTLFQESITPDVLNCILFENIIIDNLNILAIKVYPGEYQPYYLKKYGQTPKGVYYYKHNHIYPVPYSEIKAFLNTPIHKPLDEKRSEIQNLTFESIANEMKAQGIELTETKMRELSIIGKDGLYTKLAFVLSDQFDIPTKVALFEGNDMSVFTERHEISGSIIKQFRETMEFINSHNKSRALYLSLNRNDYKDYPQEAIKEALANAFCHRDYTIKSPNSVSIFENRIEIRSIGSLANGLNKDSVLASASIPTNPGLTCILKTLNLVDNYGAGINKIMRCYISLPSKPEITIAPNLFMITLPNINEINLSSGMNIRDEQPAYVTPSKKETLMREKELILEFAATKESINRQEVEGLLRIGTTKAFRLLKELCEKGLLSFKGQGKSTKYFLP